MNIVAIFSQTRWTLWPYSHRQNENWGHILTDKMNIEAIFSQTRWTLRPYFHIRRTFSSKICMARISVIVSFFRSSIASRGHRNTFQKCFCFLLTKEERKYSKMFLFFTHKESKKVFKNVFVFYSQRKKESIQKCFCFLLTKEERKYCGAHYERCFHLWANLWNMYHTLILLYYWSRKLKILLWHKNK